VHIKYILNRSSHVIFTDPRSWKVKRSTPFFTKENVPAALLSHHNTAAGVFGQLCVMEGTVTYYGFADEQATEPEAKSLFMPDSLPPVRRSTGTASNSATTPASIFTSGWQKKPTVKTGCFTRRKRD
jgi:tellurite resistance-related uncharacterized protein